MILCHLQEKSASEGQYITIGMHIFASIVTLTSALADMHALLAQGQHLLGLKACAGEACALRCLEMCYSTALGIMSAVFSVKAFDYVLIPYFVNDLNAWRNNVNGSEFLISSFSRQFLADASSPELQTRRFIKFVLGAGILGALAALFFHSVIGVIQAGAAVERQTSRHIDSYVDVSTKRKRRFVFCAIRLENTYTSGAMPSSHLFLGFS